jgi:multisubunit Na+/H+ antiporter MnhG subunit
VTVALVALGVAAELVCCAGLVLAHTTLARAHYAGAGSGVGPAVVAVAVLVEEGPSSTALLAFVAAALLFVLGAAAAHAVAVHAVEES